MILKGILLACVCSLGSLLAHIAITFFRKGRQKNEPVIFELMRHTRLLMVIWSFSFLIYALMFFLGFGNISEMSGTADFIYGIIFYLMLSFIYLAVYYFIARSVSATLLELIDDSPGKKLTIGEIKDIYNVERKYQNELNGMLQGRFIIEESGYYRTSFKGRSYARLARFVKHLLKLGPGG